MSLKTWTILNLVGSERGVLMVTRSAATAAASNATIAQAAYKAYVTKDRAALEALLADDFHFTSPLDNRLDRETYLRRCWPNSELIAGFDFIHVVTDADRVFVTYEGRNTDGRRFRNTEILTIRDQHIVDVEVYFGWSLPHDAPEGGFVDRAN
jgi:ketosteroid isomerase-like protein